MLSEKIPEIIQNAPPTKFFSQACQQGKYLFQNKCPIFNRPVQRMRTEKKFNCRKKSCLSENIEKDFQIKIKNAPPTNLVLKHVTKVEFSHQRIQRMRTEKNLTAKKFGLIKKR